MAIPTRRIPPALLERSPKANKRHFPLRSTKSASELILELTSPELPFRFQHIGEVILEDFEWGGRYREYGLNLDALKISVYVSRHTGSHRWSVEWDFQKLKRAVDDIDGAQRRLAKLLGGGRAVTGEEVDFSEPQRTIFKYGRLFWLLRSWQSDSLDRKWVAIPGLDHIPAKHNVLIAKLIRVMCRDSAYYVPSGWGNSRQGGRRRIPLREKRARTTLRKAHIVAAREVRKAVQRSAKTDYSSSGARELFIEDQVRLIARKKGVNEEALLKFADGNETPANWSDRMMRQKKIRGKPSK